MASISSPQIFPLIFSSNGRPPFTVTHQNQKQIQRERERQREQAKSIAMDISSLSKKLGLPSHLVRKALELRRLSDLHLDSSILGIGEICKAVICLELAATKLQVPFDRQEGIRLSGMSEKAYTRSFNALQNGLGVKTKVDIRELGIQFGCVRLIPLTQKGLSLYKERFLAALPPSRRATADFNRPVFTAVAFYLCARKNKLKVDKLKLIELCGTSESEFSSVFTSMNDLCFDVFGVQKEKKDAKKVKSYRELLDTLPSKRKHEDDGGVSDDSSDSIDDEDGLELPSYKRRKRVEKLAYEDWKSSIMESNSQSPPKRAKQTRLKFGKKSSEPIALEA
ncbi:origin of replication complex subunit 6 isoform X2 [Amborella trichopoda]|uniref:origin of replication complex subunit 6 isoform X2 n=1 Tax=Amborella trichopoda TaxID=13333 RepID=UPI0009BEF2DE|nr:origin of replication complex subunit 6 isoform X2 [Amborella trichopoda]|eukprot:XP_020530545.1 origin of replication complex subunit 6 isoform X2 [Amborella trichopoda]